MTEGDVEKGEVVNTATASGKISGDGTVNVSDGKATVEVEQYYKLTIHYVDEEGNPIVDGEGNPVDYTGSIEYGKHFHVDSPSVPGYKPSYDFIESDEKGMPAQDVEVTVTYTKDEPVSDDNNDDNGGNGGNGDNGGNNGNGGNGNTTTNTGTTTSDDDDDDDDDTVVSVRDSSGNKSRSNTKGNSGTDGSVDDGTAVQSDEGAGDGSTANGNAGASGASRARSGGNGSGTDDGGAYITISDDGEPQLVSASDTEAPLANLEFGDHKCNVLRLLILLAAFAVVLVHTQKMRQYQSRIFELKEKLDEERK